MYKWEIHTVQYQLYDQIEKQRSWHIYLTSVDLDKSAYPSPILIAIIGKLVINFFEKCTFESNYMIA